MSTSLGTLENATDTAGVSLSKLDDRAQVVDGTFEHLTSTVKKSDGGLTELNKDVDQSREAFEMFAEFVLAAFKRCWIGDGAPRER